MELLGRASRLLVWLVVRFEDLVKFPRFSVGLKMTLSIG
jgi:hypothetical protein